MVDPIRGKDGSLQKFAVHAMQEIVNEVTKFPTGRGLHNTQNFRSETEAQRFLERMLTRKRVLKMMDDRGVDHTDLPCFVSFTTAVRCTDYAENNTRAISIGRFRHPMQVLHLVAHYLQPADSQWHTGDFGRTFLTLVDVCYGPDIKRAVKDVMISHNCKTSTRSPETREAQSRRFRARQVGDIGQALEDMIADLEARRERREAGF